MRALAALAPLLLLGGCAYTGDPLPPLANIPERVQDLSALQRGDALVVEFTVPRLTTEGVAIRREIELDLRAGPQGEPFDENAWAASARRATPVREENFRARGRIPVGDFAGREVMAGVRVVGANGRSVGWSNFVVVRVVAPPERPKALRAVSMAGGVKLTWQAAGRQFRVLRREDAAERFTLLATAPAAEYADLSAEAGRPYVYRVQSVTPVGENSAESEISDEVRIVPEDRFPPAPPQGLTALASSLSVELTWEPAGEPDIAGYRIYRAAPGEDFRRLAEAPAIPSFSDRTVERAKTYRYRVTAFDRTGNESGPSAAVESALP